jgi:uncharacterized membrane protein
LHGVKWQGVNCLYYRDYLLFFSIYAILGWLIETIFASVPEGKLINRGFLNGFFCPIYGFGAVLVILSSHWINSFIDDGINALALLVLLSIILVTALEYITGYVLEKVFNCKWWDYSDDPANINGYVCLQYSLLWGFLAAFLVTVIHPQLSARLTSIPVSLRSVLASVLLLYLTLDTVKSVIEVLGLREAILNYSNISVQKYYQKVQKHKRFFLAFPRLLLLNADIIHRDVRSILNVGIIKIKDEIKDRSL